MLGMASVYYITVLLKHAFFEIVNLGSRYALKFYSLDTYIISNFLKLWDRPHTFFKYLMSDVSLALYSLETCFVTIGGDSKNAFNFEILACIYSSIQTSHFSSCGEEVENLVICFTKKVRKDI